MYHNSFDAILIKLLIILRLDLKPYLIQTLRLAPKLSEISLDPIPCRIIREPNI